MIAPASAPPLKIPRQRPVLRREPLPDHLDPRRIVPALPEPQQKAHHAELRHRPQKSVSQVRGRPPCRDQRQALARPDAIDQHSHRHLSHRHAEKKRKNNYAILCIGKVKLLAQHRRHQRQHLPVQNIDRDGQKQQQHDAPLQTAPVIPRDARPRRFCGCTAGQVPTRRCWHSADCRLPLE